MSVLSVSGLSLESVRGRSLVEIFQDASLELPAGEVVLLVGPSGGGKSLFTKLLAGLLGPWTGTLRIAPTARMNVSLRDGRTLDVLEHGHYPAGLRGAVGYMFQDHALFDELTVEENILFGRDQAREPLSGEAWQTWLHESAGRLRLERLLSSPIAPLSGGQRQRVSLLRMLALRPEIMVFDEPTSGLDPDSASRVADMIREAQHEGPPELRPRLSLVVTHDYANLLRIADRVAILDPSRRFSVREIKDETTRAELAIEVPKIFARWEGAKGRDLDRASVRRIQNDADWRAFASLPAVTRERIAGLPRLYLRSWRWQARFAWSTVRLLVLNAIPFTALGGAAVGLVLAYFSLNSIPQAIQGQAEPIFIEELLRGLGLALFQVLAPLFAAICLAARSGAAVSGHVSNLERSSQLDALRVLGMPPFGLLGEKVVVSFALGMPLLAAVTFVSATAASLAVVLLTRPLATFYTWKGSFFAGLGHGPLDFPYHGTGWLLLKLVPAGILCGLIAWREGARPKSSSEDVNRAITRTIMQGILVVLAVFFLVLLVEIRDVITRIAAIGMPGAGRTTLLARVVAAATRGEKPLARLPELATELTLRGLHREDPEARPGSRTTRQILDAVLRDGALAPGAPEDESLFLETDGGTVELVDTSGARLANDALMGDTLHPFRELEREAAGIVLVLDAVLWGGEVRETERDRVRTLLRRLAAAGRERKRPIPVALVLARADLAPSTGHALSETAAREPGLEPSGPWKLGKDDAALELVHWVLARAGRRERSWAKRRAVVGGAALGVALAAVLAWGFLSVRSIANRPLAATAADELRFLESSRASLRVWSFLPQGGARVALHDHALNLEVLLRDHAALAEPAAAASLQAAQYRTALEALAIVDAELGTTAERASIESRLREKARVAAMPPASEETLAAWEELHRGTLDPEVKEHVIAPRIRGVETELLAEAEREAAAIPDYPRMFEPLERFRKAHGLVPDALAAAEVRQWDRAFALLFGISAGAPEPQEVLAALEAAPLRPSPAFRKRAGRLVGNGLLAGKALPSGTKLEALLGEPGAQGFLSVFPHAYEEMVALPRALGPARVAAITSVVALVPRPVLPPLEQKRLAAFDAHLDELAHGRCYALRIVHASVSARFDVFYHAFDMTVAASAEHAPERTRGPFPKQKDVSVGEVFGAGEFPWRAWDALEVRVFDAKRGVGLTRKDPGSCFGLRTFSGEWTDPGGDGAMTIEVTPAPPGPFDFQGWPE